MHYLNLYIDENPSDCRTLNITDISLYDSEIAVTNPVIKINIPKDSCDYLPVFKVRGTSYYTTNSFGITKASCGQDLCSLPDGIYRITYSVCPNEEIFVTYSILRDCQTRSNILFQLGNLLRGCCEGDVKDGYGNDITNKRIEDLRDLILILDSAKIEAKNHAYSQAEEKLKYVGRKLNSFVNR